MASLGTALNSKVQAAVAASAKMVQIKNWRLAL